MSEIEKMYENAGIEKRMACYFECFSETCSVDCEHFEKLDMGYPLFTPEKQLKLIALLANREIRISPTYMCSGYRLNDIGKVICSRNVSTFENSLAQHINAIWQDLTEEEKQHVKGILE